MTLNNPVFLARDLGVHWLWQRVFMHAIYRLPTEHHAAESGLSKKTARSGTSIAKERSQAVEHSFVRSSSVARLRARDVDPGIDLDVGRSLEPWAKNGVCRPH